MTITLIDERQIPADEAKPGQVIDTIASGPVLILNRKVSVRESNPEPIELRVKILDSPDEFTLYFAPDTPVTVRDVAAEEPVEEEEPPKLTREQEKQLARLELELSKLGKAIAAALGPKMLRRNEILRILAAEPFKRPTRHLGALGQMTYQNVSLITKDSR